MTTTETIPYYGGTLTRLAAACATPADTYRAATALAKTVFPREVATDAVMRLHGLSHAAALQLAETVTPYTVAFTSEAERLAFERGQERRMDGEGE